MKYKKLILLQFFLSFNIIAKLSFDKVIIWGHKLHSHTHSYIHSAFFKAFNFMGYNTLWLDKEDDLKNIDFSNSLFLTEGQADQNIPLREDCFYILHNCNFEKYNELIKKNRCIYLQVYTLECEERNVTKLENGIFCNPYDRIIYMPWATDLLPEEIEKNKTVIQKIQKSKKIYFIGTIGIGNFGNQDKTDSFKKACQENGIDFEHLTNVTNEENILLTQQSFMAPALQGEWQCEQGYIPCRIFKNISYGQIGITNSETVYKFFNKKIVYNSNTYQLFYDALEKLKNIQQEELFELMDFVKNNHTYINRINTLLNFIEWVNAI